MLTKSAQKTPPIKIPPSDRELDKIIRNALREDIGKADLTSRAIIPKNLLYSGSIIVKEEGVIAGLQVAKHCFRILDPEIKFAGKEPDGRVISRGTIVANISGPARSILTAERVALNFLQRMSGISSLTRQFVEAVKGTSAVILDTRKTAPGLRLLDKWAVFLGGGKNHRCGLYDMILIKENHIAVAGGIGESVKRVEKWQRRGIAVEVEVRDISELKEALQLPVDRILLDNMSLDQMSRAVKLAQGKIPLEASGNINLQNVAEVAHTGVDFISIGALTHSPRALDISLLLTGTN
ncbi:MAG: carboxylating nicotinate-nucleotide diphosphorylase [bacterium]|nr:MAG: carboxylating nicotinate-nucleotide diphosphorylase [bacterium]